LADDESREDFVFENGKERKRNPPEGKKQKEVPHPLHGSTWQGQGKYFTMLFLRRRVPR
jgi:DNA-binding protein H-NS